MPLFRKKQIPELWQISPCLPGSGGAEQVGGMEQGGGQAEFKPSHYALRYRDQKATSQINEAPAWAEPLPSTDGREGSVP